MQVRNTITNKGAIVEPGLSGDVKISGYSVPTYINMDMTKKYTLASRRNCMKTVLGTKLQQL